MFDQHVRYLGRWSGGMLLLASLLSSGCGGGKVDPVTSAAASPRSSAGVLSSAAPASNSSAALVSSSLNSSSAMVSSATVSSASSSVSAPHSSSNQSSSSASSTVNQSVQNGATHYAQQCAVCHGDAGESDFFPDLTGNCTATNCADQTALATYISSYMPSTDVTACQGNCATDVAAFIIATFQGQGTQGPTSAVTFACDANNAQPEADVWRRLSHSQYRNTVRDLITRTLGSGQANAILEAAWAEFEQLPVEQRPLIDQDLHGTYRRIEQSVYQSHVEAWYYLSLKLADEMTLGNRAAALVGSCYGQSSGVQTCVNNFVRDFGALVLRRSLTSADISFFSSFYGAFTAQDAEAYEHVVAGLLNAPEFLYLIEHGQSASDRQSALTAYELASRLSYHFWNSMPDAELFAAAANNSLLTEQGFQAQVDRLFASARTQETIRQFYREWLKLENLERLDSENYLAAYQVFAGANLPSEQLHRDMQNDVLDLLDYGTWEAGFNLSEFFTSQLIFPTSNELAAIYGVSPQLPGVGVLMPNNRRPGLLTRPALLASRGMNTRPILKGVFIRENLLCDDIPAPPDNAQADLPELSPLLTTREEVEAITEREGTSCTFCHQNLINGLGFPTENFDALGRWRDQELLLDGNGNLLGYGTINTTAQPRATAENYNSVNNAQGLMDELIASEKLEACFARHYFRFTFARWEDEQQDGCALEQLRSTLVTTGSVQEMLKAVAQTPAFKTKMFNQSAGN